MALKTDHSHHSTVGFVVVVVMCFFFKKNAFLFLPKMRHFFSTQGQLESFALLNYFHEQTINNCSRVQEVGVVEADFSLAADCYDVG